MTGRVVVERAAQEDLFEAVDSIRRNSPPAARRFVAAARAPFARLAEHSALDVVIRRCIHVYKPYVCGGSVGSIAT